MILANVKKERGSEHFLNALSLKANEERKAETIK